MLGAGYTHSSRGPLDVVWLPENDFLAGTRQPWPSIYDLENYELDGFTHPLASVDPGEGLPPSGLTQARTVRRSPTITPVASGRALPLICALLRKGERRQIGRRFLADM